MTQIDPQIAFQMHFQKLMHDVFSQTNSCIQEVSDYMYQLQMNLLLQSSQMSQQQQQQCQMPQQYTSYDSQMPQQQQQYITYDCQMPHQQQQCTSYMPMQMTSQMAPQMMMMPQQQQQQWQQQHMNNIYQNTVTSAVTPVVVQPPTPPPSVPKSVAPKVTVTPPPAEEDVPIVKLRIKTKPKDPKSSGQLTPPSSISNRNSLIDELRNSGGRKSLRKVSRKEILPKKEEPLPAWIRSRDREKRSSFNPPPNSFETLEALLLAKDHQKSMPNLRTLSRANSDEQKSISPLASPTEKEEPLPEKPKPPTNTNVAVAIKAALEAAEASKASPESSHTSSTEIIPQECEVEEATEETDYDLHPSTTTTMLPTTRALVPHRQLNPEYPEAPHGWQLLMWTIRKVGKFLKKHDENHHHEKDWELIHHKH